MSYNFKFKGWWVNESCNHFQIDCVADRNIGNRMVDHLFYSAQYVSASFFDAAKVFAKHYIFIFDLYHFWGVGIF